MLPFTVEQFLAVFAAYNTATWPAPVLAYIAAGVALWLALRGGDAAGRIVALVLAALWAWTGIAYHGVFFAAINPAARGFAAMFVVQAALLAWFGAWRGAVAFGPPQGRVDMAAGLGLILYAGLLYPWLGRLAGHAWPAAPSFGVTPCPLTILTLGLFLLARGRVPAALLVIPLIWSLVGGSAALLLGVPEDWMLPVAGLAATALLWRRRRRPLSQAA